MTLYFVGLGLSDEKDITIKGLEAVKKCEKIYLEVYTSQLNCSLQELEAFYGKKIMTATRATVETLAEETILRDAQKDDTALLVVGDPLAATTHIDLMLRARKMGIRTKVIHNASIMNAIAATGLQLYKFGKTTSLPFPEKSFEPETAYDIIKKNKIIGAHTLVLLDLRPTEGRFMTANDVIRQLLKIEMKRNEGIFTEQTLMLGCARIGAKDEKIAFGTANAIMKEEFGKPVHCLVVPGSLHFVEEEILKNFIVA